jgi:LysR family hydrogen peroxide-inducible transcriptional activator
MEIHQLRYFVAVADEGSFSRAAAKVRVAQPSLSQQIRKLEAEIGQPLFDRLPRSVVLTEAGRCFIDYARQILTSIEDARRCVNELDGEISGTLAVGAIPTIAPYVLPQLVRNFHEHYPEVTLEIVEDVTDGITRRIEAGELDVALASTCQQSPTLRREWLDNEPLLALSAGASPARVASTSSSDRAGGQPAYHDREHGRGVDRCINCAAADGKAPSYPGMHQFAVYSAGSGTGAKSSLQPASVSEQSGHSIP